MRISDWSSDVCSSDLVESGADQRVKLDGLALNQHGFECLDAKTVKRRGAVQHDRVLANDFVEDVPDFLALLFDPLFGLLQGHRKTLGVKTRVDERLEQPERHLQIGRASCRERVWQDVEVPVVAG